MSNRWDRIHNIRFGNVAGYLSDLVKVILGGELVLRTTATR
jgi:hypothetical protein